MSHLQKDRDRNWRILRNGHYHEWLELMKLLTDVACFFPCRIIKAKKYEGVSNCIIPYCQNEKRLDAGNIYIYIYISYRKTYFIFISFTSTIKKKNFISFTDWQKT